LSALAFGRWLFTELGEPSMVDYAITYIFWIAIAVVLLKILKDSINR